LHLVKTPVFTLVMINRVLIRLKIIQIVYAYYQNGSKNLDAAEKELFFSLSKAYDLYNYLLMLMIALTNYAQKRIDAAKAKLAPISEHEVCRKQIHFPTGSEQAVDGLYFQPETYLGE